MNQSDDLLAAMPSGRAASGVISSLERRITSGELRDGTHLPSERELMETFGVSRTVVREALTTLASRGLLDAKPRHRPVVRQPGYHTALKAVEGAIGHLLSDPSGIKNLFDTRIFIEKALVRHAALHATRRDMEALKLALDANQATIGISDQFYATDVAFHGTLYEIPKNPVFEVVHNAYVAWLSPHWRKMPSVAERNRTNYQRHLEIYTAIQNRDPEAAEEAMHAHLVSAWEFVRGTFG